MDKKRENDQICVLRKQITPPAGRSGRTVLYLASSFRRLLTVFRVCWREVQRLAVLVFLLPPMWETLGVDKRVNS